MEGINRRQFLGAAALAGTGMAVRVEKGKDFMETTGWARFGIFSLELCANEFAAYTIYDTKDETKLTLDLTVLENGNITVMQDGKSIGSVKTEEKLVFPLFASAESKIMIHADSGRFVINSLFFN